MINGVIFDKLQTMDEILLELTSLGKVSVEDLKENWQKRKAIERNLQILCEIIIDVCQRAIAIAGQSPATTGADAVDRCVSVGMLSAPEPYDKMIQFRNFIVHRYEKVDPGILVDLVNNRLVDFERFRDEVLRFASD